ncbi:MAG: hypothetical protein HKM02_12775 [Pseudomonadales bacterium]|nr:hypothetical protein [Pseudomonadales bacterium]
MSLFKGAVLFSAISLISSGAFALQAMDDAGLADATGQSGLTITSTLNMTSAVVSYTDTDGLGAGSAAASAGSMNIHGLGLSSNGGAMTTNIDVGSNASGQAVMQIQTIIPTLAISFDGIDLTSAPATVGSASRNNFIVTNGVQTIKMSGLNMTMQLGDTSPQGHLMVLSNSAPTSFTLGSSTATNQVVLVDAAVKNGSTTSTPGIGVGGLSVTGLSFGSSTTNPSSNTTVDATSAGLVVAFGSTAMQNVGVSMTNVTMGETCVGVSSGCTATAPIGNINISGLNMSGTTVTIRGH